ncbi:hypothetical protein Vretifemale_9103 [Volvox reticuliferus]|uniref:Guanylate cyclase domain-containing protein n=1 Tax=Volvox reticuliferus TaxID=1737510 RepID=A0A8J4CDY3_9CHLO|nr:hypothetical protein Vretifemale_9103 [Volvox reticuliferus]
MSFARDGKPLALILACLLVVADVWTPSGQQLVFNETSVWCADVAAKALRMSCLVNNTEDAFIRIVARNYTACVENNGTHMAPTLPVMVPTHLYATYQQFVDDFVDSTRGQLAVVPVDVDQLMQEALFEYSGSLSSTHHAWIMYLDSYYPLEQYSALQDLSNMTEASSTAKAVWADLPPGFQQLSYSFNGVMPGPNQIPKMLSVPLDASTPLMYYLPEVLARYNLSVPRTWSEVLYMARKFNGTDVDGDNSSDYAVCFKPDPDCSYASALGMVLAPYLQYKGTAQGAFLRPENLAPLFQNAGARAALTVFSELMKYQRSLALQGEDCLNSTSVRDFMKGDCILAFGWGDLFKSVELMSQSDGVKPKYAISMLPGSEFVYDRDTMDLKACTAELCPYGLNNKTEHIVHQGVNASMYVNRAPYLPYTGAVGVVSANVEPNQQQLAFDFLIFLAERNRELALSPNSSVLPYRKSLLNSSNATLIAEFVAAGFNPITTAAYMDATLATLGHGNLVPGPMIPRVEALRALLAIAAANLSRASTDLTVVLDELQATVLNQVLEYDSSTSWIEQLKSAYWHFIGYTPAAPGGRSGDGHGMDIPAVSLAVPVASALVVLVASTLYEFKKHRQHRSLFGKVVAPGPFEDTTLLVTDIQDSTALWEMLPSNVMDRAIKEHHTCLRKLLLKHSGYESATEGDSFLLAFHCPEDALLFAMESQVALLECAWPIELLDCDVCRPYYVVHNDTDKRANLIVESADAAGSLMALPRANSGLSNKSTSEDTSSPQASNALGTPGSEANTFMTACQASWKEGSATTPNNVLIFRGLRVRMGMHTGISNEADVAYNKAAARMQYSGEILQYAKSVSDAAAGGMILLSDATYRRLPIERLWDKAMVMHVGEYKLKDDLPVLSLFQVTGRRLMGRLGYLSGMRFKEQLSKGVFAAPLGPVAMGYVGIVGITTLLAWDEATTREALALLHSCVVELSHKWGGYLVEATDEQVHAVFPGAADTLLWALAVHQALMELPWPEVLLDHKLAEELIVGDVVVFRGLRVKTGVDVGHAVGEVNALTGRICYRGKVVLRAARVMQSASSNQVLASGEAWAAALVSSSGLLQLRGVVGDRLGPFKLRGIADRVEMVQIRLQRADVAGADGWAQDLQEGGVGGASPVATREVAGTDGDGGSVVITSSAGGTAASILQPADSSKRQVFSGDSSGAAERSMSGGRGFGFLSRASRGGAAQSLAASAPSRSASLLQPIEGAAGSTTECNAIGGLPLPPQSSGSPRLFSSLRLFGSTRAQSFTAGLLHRMANSNRSRGAGSRASGLVDTSAASISGGDGTVAATTATAAVTVGITTGTATPSISVARESAAETVASSVSAIVPSAPFSVAASTLTNVAPGGNLPIAVNPSGRSAACSTAPVAQMGTSLPSSSQTSASISASLNILRGFRGGGGNTRGVPSLTGSQPFPFPSARRLLPSNWTLGGGGGSGNGGGFLSSGGSPAGGGGLQGLSSSLVRTYGDLSGLASMVATSLPASRSCGHVSNVVATSSTPADHPDVSITMGGGGSNPVGGNSSGGALAGSGGSTTTSTAVGAGGMLSGDVSGGGWFPGEMLADVLHGVQEEDERLSGRGSVAAARSPGVSSVMA